MAQAAALIGCAGLIASAASAVADAGKEKAPATPPPLTFDLPPDLPPDAQAACVALTAQRQALAARIDSLPTTAAASGRDGLRAVTLPALRALVTDILAQNDEAFPRCKAALLALPPDALKPPATLAALLYLPHVQMLARLRAQVVALDAPDQPLRPVAAALADAISAQAVICAAELDPTQCADLRRAAAALDPLPAPP